MVLTWLWTPSAMGQTSYFSTTPTWVSRDGNNTYCLAVGDVDRDGDLDIVFANQSQRNTLYLNSDGLIEPTPIEPFSQQLTTYATALGDIDGDHDLDVVFGNFGGPIALYLNQGGPSVFESTPVWDTGSDVMVTRCIVLGDVDLDGDLDMVCANGSPSGDRRLSVNRLYLNTGGMFESAPAWESADSSDTRSVALGDIDGDGRLDVVFGNSGSDGLANTVYLNVGGASVFGQDPAWRSGDLMTTTAVALGDMDGDGDLDLICGNGDLANQRNVSYENTGGIFESLPSWRTVEASRTTAVAVGDVEGDGDLDLVFCDSYTLRLYVNGPTGPDTTSAMTVSLGRNPCRALALADFDMDGDLDLVTGISGPVGAFPKNTVLDNVTWPYASAPSWQADGTAPRGWDVELGDLDGDGYPDIVYSVGTADVAALVFRNQQGRFDPVPSQVVSGRGGDDLVLGDIDNDGDLDLISSVGLTEQRSVAFLNVGGSFVADPPAWTGPLAAPGFWGMTLGDVDGDRLLDLIVGTSLVSQSPSYLNFALLFLNTGEPNIFGNLPNWTSNDEVVISTYSTALADVDRDGDPDLLCANFAFGDRLYRNDNGMFEGNHWWESPSPDALWGTLADMNGDGWPDLVSHTEQNILVYLNSHDPKDPIEHDPWAFIDYVPLAMSGLSIGDVDMDGDLDIVTRYGVVFNERGVVGADGETRIWGAPASVRNTALADVDRDGDLDVVTSSAHLADGGRDSAYFNRKYPPFKGDPGNPTHQLANNGAFIRNVASSASGSNSIHIEFTVYDVESDEVWVIPEYQFEGEWEFIDLDMTGAAGPLGPLASSPTGVTHAFDWDITRLPFDARNVILRLRTATIPSRVSTVQHAAAYFYPVGQVSPVRPEISIPTATLDFPTVTVGDTTGAKLVLSNVGTATLEIRAIQRPLEMMCDPPPPFTVAPGADRAITVYMVPCTTLVAADLLRVESNDPLRPMTSVGVTTDIRALEIESELLSPTEVLPLGEAVTVSVVPAPDVVVERGYLYYRATGAATFADSIALSSSRLGFIAVIPGTGITESGLDYYVRVENGCAETMTPPGAPSEWYSRPVHPPVTVTTTPVPTGESGFLEGLNIRVGVELPQGASFVSGTVHYRPGGAAAYDSTEVALEDGASFAVLPDSVVGVRGVEYWVEVRTGTRTLTDPAASPQDNPRTIRVSIRDLQEASKASGEHYRMLSVPLDFGADFTGTLTSILSDQAEFGAYDKTRWRCYRYATGEGAYAELADSDAEPLFYLKPGRGFWLISRDAHRVATAPMIGTSVATDMPFEIALEPGWNQIGHPFVFPVLWAAMTVDTMTAATAVDSGIVQAPVGYRRGAGYTYGIAAFEPFEGYWVKNLSTSPVILRVPPVEAPRPVQVAASDAEADDDVEEEWTVWIRAESAELIDDFNAVGIDRRARAGWDARDQAEAPSGPGRMITLYFPHDEWETQAGNYTTDIRPGYEVLDPELVRTTTLGDDTWGQAWRFDIAKNFTDDPVGDEVTLEFTGLLDVPREARVYLIDHDMRQSVDVRQEGRYVFYLGERQLRSDTERARFTLVVGSEAFVGETPLPALPAQTMLHPNQPNPFNPTTLIKYDIAEAGEVTIRVYDARGRRVRDVYRGFRAPGRYVAAWHGDNETGQPVASGIYFYRLETAGIRTARKMVLLK